MKRSILIASWSGLLSAALASSTKNQFDTQYYASNNVITRDVAVIGGGATGIYGAINLRALGKSVILIEKEASLGGHTNTYIDPATGLAVNYGVQALYNISVARDYLALLGVPMGPFQYHPVTRVYADFQTGQVVTDVQASSDLSGYAAQLEKYPYLEYSWDLPSPVPADLLVPFRDFIAKYNLQDIAYSVYFGGEGFANVLNQLTVNVFKMIDSSYINSMAGAAFQPASGNNGEIYTKASAALGSDALYSSTVVAAQRSSNHSGVRLIVKTPSGQKLVKASKLLISIPPLLDNMTPFDLDSTERDLFSQWSYTNYFVMLVKNTGLPSGFQFANANASTSTFNIPNLPAPYQITETRIPGLFYVWYGSPRTITRAAVEADVTAVIKRLRTATDSTVTTPPQFIRFDSHTPFKLVVGAKAITSGFYNRLEGLQGRRNTWYTGAAFLSHDASILWNFTHSLLPEIVA